MLKDTLRNFIPALLIVALGLGIYANSLHGEFQFDDLEYIVGNPAIRDISDITQIYLSRPVPTRFIPLLTLAVNYHLHKLDVFGYHLFNVIIHLINAGLVYWLTLLICSFSKFKNQWAGRKKYTLSLGVAFLFLTHPVQTQAVSYITQRFTSLAALFYLLSLCLYFCGRQYPLNSFKSTWRICLAFLSGLTAMFCKQTALTLPVIIILCELFFIEENEGFRNLRKIWRFVVVCFLLILVIPGFYLFKMGGILSNRLISGSHEGDLITGWAYLLTQIQVVVKYIQLLFLPINLNLDYDFPLTPHIFEIKTFLCLSILVTLIVISFKCYHRRPLITFGIGWFFITLLVESSIIPISHVIFEHRLYLPSFGFFLIVVYALHQLIKQERILIPALMIMVLTCSLLTMQRNAVWKTPVTLWQDVIKKSPQKPRGYLNLGKAYLDRRDYRQALSYLNKSIQLKPQNYDAFNYRGLLLYQQGLLSMAVDDFTRAVEIDSTRTAALVNRGNVYRKIGQYALALSDINQAIEKSPEDFRHYINRGNVYAKMELYGQALADFQKVIKLQPHYLEVYKNIGNVYEFQGRYDLALAEYNKFLEYSPDDVDGQILKGTLLARQNKNQEAVLAYDQALRLDPQRGDVYYKRSFLHYIRQEYSQAYDDIIRAQYLGQKVDSGYITRLKTYKDQ
ncbi:MAG: tetratricopeptide repeat protein [Candidatus Omnitrophota bacterium]